ncbi:rhomboid family intramembrane serine protease [Allomuricauda sp. M10]|uniref:rhomboid family intramembrane serine protease n=1 Tax=Allomuricauda sp. M10 TaxID=2683292 RepID=UPI001D18ABEF|nr:rhomboid family intramembrane serine protease [Muricauda sp. M10]
MKSSEPFKIPLSVVLAPLVAVLCIWSVYWYEVGAGVNLNDYGVYPRKLWGLRGVVLSPFIHGSVEHLYNNTIPLAILLAFLFYFYQKVALKVLVYGVLLSGFLTWSIGRPSYHIGASGVIYVLASFIFFKGILAKYYRLVALSLVVVFIYGSMIWYIFPVREEISWEGHLAGFITGLVLAFLMKAEIPSLIKYDWEKDDFKEEDDPFLKHFDENGNFIENMEIQDEPPIQIRYHYKKSEED